MAIHLETIGVTTKTGLLQNAGLLGIAEVMEAKGCGS